MKLEFIKAWNEGFADGVIGALNKMLKVDGLIKNNIYRHGLRQNY
jgi:hypothetical protein